MFPSQTDDRALPRSPLAKQTPQRDLTTRGPARQPQRPGASGPNRKTSCAVSARRSTEEAAAVGKTRSSAARRFRRRDILSEGHRRDTRLRRQRSFVRRLYSAKPHRSRNRARLGALQPGSCTDSYPGLCLRESGRTLAARGPLDLPRRAKSAAFKDKTGLVCVKRLDYWKVRFANRYRIPPV